MESAMLTIPLSDELQRSLDSAAKEKGVSATEYMLEALRRRIQMDAIDEIRAIVMPRAAAAGYASEDEFLRDVS